MIVTATIDGIIVEASGTVGECVTFIREILKPEVEARIDGRWWDGANERFFGKSIADMIVPKNCDPFKTHFGSCGAHDCPVSPDGKIRIKKRCPECDDTGHQGSIDVNWRAGTSDVDRFRRFCPEGCK